MKATDVIRRDHQAAKDLFEQYKEGSEEEREVLAEKIFDALTAHEKMEDTYFYPVVLEAVPEEDKAAFEELDREQGELERETLKVRAMTVFGERDAEIMSLMEKVLAHAEKEEQIVLAKADEILSPEKLEEMGAEMERESAVAKSEE